MITLTPTGASSSPFDTHAYDRCPSRKMGPNRFSWNPFSTSKRASAQHVSSSSASTDGSGLLSRALSTAGRRNTASKNSSAPRPTTPPPAYSATADPAPGPASGASPVNSRSRSGAHSPLTVETCSTAEDPYAFLSKFDTIFLIDDSGSMAGRSWRETKQAMKEILPIIFSHDQDGPDIYFMNHRSNDVGSPEEPWKATSGYRNVIRETGRTSMREQFTVEELFTMTQPRGATPTGTRLGHILRPYMKAYAEQVRATGDEACLTPLNIIVVTDGVPSDDVESVIVQVAGKLDALGAPPWQVGIQFFQVGNEPGAAEGLRQLDDDISSYGGGVRDIVDTTTFDDGRCLSSDGILKAVLGAVIKRLDRRNTPARSRGRF